MRLASMREWAARGATYRRVRRGAPCPCRSRCPRGPRLCWTAWRPGTPSCCRAARGVRWGTAACGALCPARWTPPTARHNKQAFTYWHATHSTKRQQHQHHHHQHHHLFKGHTHTHPASPTHLAFKQLFSAPPFNHNYSPPLPFEDNYYLPHLPIYIENHPKPSRLFIFILKWYSLMVLSFCYFTEIKILNWFL